MKMVKMYFFVIFYIGVTGSSNGMKCYGELGCFSNDSPWRSAIRPFPPPMSPAEINVRIHLHTRGQRSKQVIDLWPSISISNSDFETSRCCTVFIIHGFASSGDEAWVNELAKTYLQNKNGNVFVVDWEKGASQLNYLQVASNIRIVAAEIVRFIEYLIKTEGLDPRKLHLIGHSLGAHASAYVGKKIRGIGRITGLDPAGPGFEKFTEGVKLHKNDAEFVDVIHTDATPLIPLSFGITEPVGDIDFYVNGGFKQPGCSTFTMPEKIDIYKLSDLGKFSVEYIREWTSCSHSRSYKYFIEAIRNRDCTFWGKKELSSNSHNIPSEVVHMNMPDFLNKLKQCRIDTCSPLGLDTIEYPTRGSTNIVTNSKSPFCRDDPNVTQRIKKQLEQREKRTGRYRTF